jgi:hypothetical protein
MPIPGLAALVVGTLLASGSYLAVLVTGTAPGWAVLGIALAIPFLLFGFLDLGARRAGGVPRASRLVFIGTALWVGLGLLGLVWSTPSDLDTPRVGGLPLPAAWMIYVLGLGPALFLPVAWAVLARDTVPDDAIRRLREARRRREAEERPDAPAALDADRGGAP